MSFPALPPATPGQLANADKVLARRFDIVGEEHVLAPGFSWCRNPSRDKEWQIAHHKFYFAVDLAHAWRQRGDPRYLCAWRDLIASWLREMGTGFITASDAQVEAKRVEHWVLSLLLLQGTEWPRHVPGEFLRPFIERIAARPITSPATCARHATIAPSSSTRCSWRAWCSRSSRARENWWKWGATSSPRTCCGISLRTACMWSWPPTITTSPLRPRWPSWTATYNSDPVTRTCTVPRTQAILVPLIACECSTAENNGTSAPELRACAGGCIDAVGVDTLKLTIDGAKVPNLQRFRAQSPLFEFTLPEDNFLGLSGVTNGSSVSDGYLVMLKPLSPGKHVVHFEGGVVSGPLTGLTMNITYHLTVQ